MHVLDITGRPGDQAANRIAGEKFDGKILDVSKQLHPEIMHDFEAGVFHDHFLGKIQAEINTDEDEKDDSCDCYHGEE